MERELAEVVQVHVCAHRLVAAVAEPVVVNSEYSIRLAPCRRRRASENAVLVVVEIAVRFVRFAA